MRNKIEIEYTFTDETIERRSARGTSKYDGLFEEFMKSDKPSCVVSLNTPKQRQALLQTFRKIIKKRNLPLMCGIYGTRQVYLVKYN